MRSRTHPLLEGRCPRCYVQARWCLCPQIPRVDTSFQIVILRHLRESYKTSNTARIAQLALPNSLILDYLPETFTDASLDPEDSALLFPAREAVWSEERAPARLFVLDGTWHQASRMAKKILPLRGMPRLSFDATPLPEASAERLRQPTEAHQRSTLEAIAMAVERLAGREVAAPLFALYRAMVTQLRAARGYPRVTDAT